jgi:hypothetical protein
MASNTKTFQKLLDSTALAATKFIRRPPIDPKTPIQGKARQPSSNAYKDHQEKEGLRLKKALNSITHGQNIFVYHHIRTKQVVYSLTRALEVSNNYLTGQDKGFALDLSEVPFETLQPILKTMRNFLIIHPLEKQPPQTMRLPRQEDRSR